MTRRQKSAAEGRMSGSALDIARFKKRSSVTGRACVMRGKFALHSLYIPRRMSMHLHLSTSRIVEINYKELL